MRYAKAESQTAGRLVSVRLGGTTVLSSSDLDLVFDKIAELHTDATMNLVYNGQGRSAMKGALDCIFDADHLTVSSIWVNENVSDLSVRGYTGVYFDGSPTDLLYFTEVVSRAGDQYVKLQGTAGVQDCAELKVTGLGSNDYFGVVTSMWTKCMNADCFGFCNVYPDGFCKCGDPVGCTTVFGPGDGNGQSIVTFIPAP